MSRVEELNRVLKANDNMLMRSTELTNAMLIEIAKSLAVIADTLQAEQIKKESEETT